MNEYLTMFALFYLVCFSCVAVFCIWTCLPVGTKSVLIGAHAFWFHPIAVALGWWKIYGFPWHPGLWLCFMFHDIGYINCDNMDGPEGEQHPVLGSKLVYWLTFGSTRFRDECLYHSRYFAKKAGRKPSRLCMADKLAPLYTPAWLYIQGTMLSGEIEEYMANGKKADPDKVGQKIASLLQSDRPSEWYEGLRSWMVIYVNNHKDGQEDTLTENRHL